MPGERRTSYEAGFKLKVVACAIETNNSVAARQFSVNEKQVRMWRKNQKSLTDMPKNKKAARGSSVAFPELEEELKGWVLSLRQNGVIVTRTMIRIRALNLMKTPKFQLLQPNSNFLASPGWCKRFINRNGLIKSEPNEGRNGVYVEECFSIERSSLSSESSRNSLSENDAEIKTEPDDDTNMEENSSNMGSTSLPDRNTWSEKNIQIKTEPGEDTDEVDMEAHSSIVVSSSPDNSRNFLFRKNPNKLIPKKESQSRGEIFEKQRDYERKHARNKNKPKRLDAFKEKDRQKYLKEKVTGIRKSNSELTNRKKRQRRHS